MLDFEVFIIELPNTMEGKGPHSIMMNINTVRYGIPML